MTLTIQRVLIALAALTAIPILALAILSATSRRPSNLGPVKGKLCVCPESPNCVCSGDDSQSRGIAPIAWKGDPLVGLERLERIIANIPRTKSEMMPDQLYLHAEVTSAWFRFVDDVEFLVDPAAEVIHIRSASRAGRSDFGVNRQRVEAIRRSFESSQPFSSR